MASSTHLWLVCLAVTLAVGMTVSPDGGSVVELGETPAKKPAPADAASRGGGSKPAPTAQEGNAGGAAEGGGAAAVGGAEEALLTPWDKQGLNVIKAYADYNTKLQKREESLREKLANPPETVKGITYQAIAGYKYKFLGREMEDKSRSECELVCSSYSACKSYSYNMQKRKCWWSMASIRYRAGSNLYVKKLSPEGKPEQLYNEMPGMYIQDKVEPLARKAGFLDGLLEERFKTSNAALNVDKKISFDECKYACTETEDCRTFTYTESQQDCILSPIEMHYEPEWTYYEKDRSLDAEESAAAHSRENDYKEELKARWIEGSSAKARVKAEKAEKVNKQLKETEKEQGHVDGEKKRAEKAMNADKSQCDLAKAASDASDKRNIMLMASLDKRTEIANQQKQKYQEAESGTKSAKTFELRTKKSLEMTLHDTSEITKKVGELKGDETTEKSRMHVANEHKAKTCGAFDLTNAVYKAKEGKQKGVEAEEKLLQAGKNIDFVTKESMKVKESKLTAEADERKAKMKITIQKSNVEASNKRSSAASDEMAKKAALQALSGDKEKLRKDETKGEEATHQVVMAKEKMDKSKEDIKKHEEKQSKAEQLVKSRKRETDMKAESLRVRKKLKLKKESDTKAESSSKNLKKEELITKKSQEQMNKGRMALDQMTANEKHKKVMLQKDEKKYKEVQKQKALETKHERTVKKNMADLEQDEKDKKYKKRRDALVQRTLAENEQHAKQALNAATQAQKEAMDKATVDEQQEKAAAAALKKASTEADTKKLMRNELNWKSVTTASNEKATKCDQQKMLASEDVVQAQAKIQAENCVHICIEGMDKRRQDRERVEARKNLPVEQTPEIQPLPTPAPDAQSGGGATPTAAPATSARAMVRRLLLQTTPVAASGGATRVATDAQLQIQAQTNAVRQDEAEKAVVAASTPVEMVLPKVEPFTYNGCEC